MKASNKITLIAATLILLSFGKLFASMTVTKNELTGETMYQEHFKLNNSIGEKEALALVQQWFTANPEKFTHGNQEQQSIPTKYTSNKATVEQTFKNTSPLQTIDTASNQIVGQSTVKYYGNELSSIWVMYIEYYVVVEIHEHELTATISHVQYHHYNPFNYAPQAIHNMNGGAFKASGKFETLSTAANSDADIMSLTEFLGNDMSRLMSDLKQNLKGGYAMARAN
jgi:hypothetical protein